MLLHTTRFTILLVNIYLLSRIVYASEEHAASYNFFQSLRSEVYRFKRELLLEDSTVEIKDTRGNTSLVADICSLPENIKEKVNVTIADVYLSAENTGQGLLTFFIGGNEIGSFNTSNAIIDIQSENSTSVELLPHSGQIGEPVGLPAGNTSLVIEILTDAIGIILSGIQINTYNQNSTQDILCGGSFYIYVKNDNS